MKPIKGLVFNCKSHDKVLSTEEICRDWFHQRLKFGRRRKYRFRFGTNYLGATKRLRKTLNEVRAHPTW